MYLIHWPYAFIPPSDCDPNRPQPQFDYDTMLWETWEAMNDLIHQGLLKNIGVSNFSVAQLEELIKDSEIVPSNNQIEIHPYCGQKELVQFCKEKNIVVTAYSPFASGKGNETKGFPLLLKHPVITRIGAEHKKTSAQVILRWVIQREIVVIPKSISPQRIIENGQIFDFSLSEQEMQQIDSLDADHKFIVPTWLKKN
eukprot:TRINITY_DN1316_c0_g1_i2.p1 TRINITY_DN1316_c0_g1~~TRINITY_DN1316_c0_g1_i2.p1  ORF type:complete len:198 (+),score=32.28 TRINITY_DN1316_c0_g1_i2:450-1043(+)